MRRDAGFSLVEAIIAITISTVVVFLAANVFLVQNDFYGFLLQRTRVQDNARSFLDVVEREVGSLVGNALLEAESTRMVVRSPQTLGGVCAVNGNIAHVHWASISTLDAPAATGFGVRDPATEEWSFTPADVDFMVHDKGPASANLCAQAGADTTFAQEQFTKVRQMPGNLGVVPTPGLVLMVYEEVELSIAQSTLDPVLVALYRGPEGGTLTEYATGIATTARFQYRRGTTWYNQVGAGALNEVDAVRIVAATHQPAESGIGTDADFEIVVDIPLRNR